MSPENTSNVNWRKKHNVTNTVYFRYIFLRRWKRFIIITFQLLYFSNPSSPTLPGRSSLQIWINDCSRYCATSIYCLVCPVSSGCPVFKTWLKWTPIWLIGWLNARLMITSIRFVDSSIWTFYCSKIYSDQDSTDRSVRVGTQSISFR